MRESRAAPGFGGIFSKIIDVAGATVGDPMLGEQVASQAGPAFANITETPPQIASRVTPQVLSALQAPASATTDISSQSQSIAQAILPGVASDLAAQGYYFAPGTVGASLQSPSVFDAFGGQYRDVAKAAAYGLAALAVLKLVAG